MPLEDNETLQQLNDLMGEVRYGVPTADKEALALSGQIPGADLRNLSTAKGTDVEQRRAAAYLFGKNYPNVAPHLQPAIDFWLRSSDDPAVLAVTQESVERGSGDAAKESRDYKRIVKQSGGQKGGSSAVRAFLAGLTKTRKTKR